MKTNDGERLVRKPEKHIRHLVLNVSDLPRHLAFDLAFEPEVVWATPLQLELLRHSLAFTSIRRAGQRASGHLSIRVGDNSCTRRAVTEWGDCKKSWIAPFNMIIITTSFLHFWIPRKLSRLLPITARQWSTESTDINDSVFKLKLWSNVPNSVGKTPTLTLI